MVEKLLSLIVPTYNMEAYLCRCLDSVTRKDVPAVLEVIVVNDGSTDGSLEIARRYEKLRSDIVKVIDKPNGNYGSCVNAALRVAEGKYVKMLDADDWYDSEGLVKMLHDLGSIDCDMFITHYRKEFTTGKEEIVRISDRWDYLKIYDVDELFGTREFFLLQMHQIGFRTQMLRDMDYHQTEGISYTDAEWTFAPLFNVEKVAFIDADVYRYFLGREGQTMQMSVLVRALSHEAKSLMAMIDFRNGRTIQPEGNLERYLNYRTAVRAHKMYFRSLTYMSDSDFEKFNLKDIDAYLLKNSLNDYRAVVSYDIRGILAERWRSRGRREYFVMRYLLGAVFNLYNRLKG